MKALVLPEHVPQDPQLGVLVVPHVGGGAAVAAGFRAACDPTWLVAGVCFGGREKRFLEPPPSGLDQMVDDVVRAAKDLTALRAPVVIMGQCSGALLAYMAAARLQHEGHPPAALVVISRPTPRVRGTFPDVSKLDEQFGEEVAGRGWLSPDLIAMPELLKLILPAVRADCAAFATAKSVQPVPGFMVPTLIINGSGDPSCPRELMNGWQEFTPAMEHVPIHSDSHLLLATYPAAVAATLARRLPVMVSSGVIHAKNE